MLRAVASSSRSSRRQFVILVNTATPSPSTSSSSLQRLATQHAGSTSLRSPVSARYFHKSYTLSADPATHTSQSSSRQQDTTPPPAYSPKSKSKASSAAQPRRPSQPTTTSASASESDRSTSAPKETPQPAATTAQSPPTTSTASPPSTTPSPPPPPPSDPKADSSISAKIKSLYHQVKFLFRFYLNGVKQIWTDRKRVQEIKNAVRTTGRELQWSEKRLIRVHTDDLKKLPLFLAILLILEEILPLVVIYAPSLLPSTCILPTQLLKIRQTEEVKRSAAVERLRNSQEVQDLMSSVGWSIKSIGDKKDTVASIESMFTKVTSADITEKFKTLSKEVLIDLSKVFSLGTTLRPTSILRNNLESHLSFLSADDAALRGLPTSTSPYSQLPESSPILAEVSTQRGLRCCEVESLEMFENLRDWLRLTSQSSSLSHQVLFLPLLLYPAPLFTPSLNKLKMLEENEATKGILERSKEVAQEVIKAEEEKARKDEQVKKEEQQRSQQ